jgi:hypothetical protein
MRMRNALDEIIFGFLHSKNFFRFFLDNSCFLTLSHCLGCWNLSLSRFSHFSSPCGLETTTILTKLVKYQAVLHVKPFNKLYVLTWAVVSEWKQEGCSQSMYRHLLSSHAKCETETVQFSTYSNYTSKVK